jgi:hypothetical protein
MNRKLKYLMLVELSIISYAIIAQTGMLKHVRTQCQQTHLKKQFQASYPDSLNQKKMENKNLL